ncbi:MAG TPA: hypothetical protein P5301_04810 [Bacteroidales bacterium]|jgi:hypothetical protein|nr:hypothetical protein [Bacteroidales bacterium]HON97874.1 hypothetical protein [Bacteroidales bacterium]HRR52769.1 hypothetical protein [Bacteroidales bacterium]
MEENVKLENYQQNIYDGLKQIGEEIASLYYDGVVIFNSELSSKSYLLAHIDREIEGGIRDILVSGHKQENQKCCCCGNVIKESNHKYEISKALGANEDDKFVQEWHDIANEFHKYAHRHGAWRTPREKETFNKLWKRFEKILNYLVGDYIKITQLMDKFLGTKQPTKEILGALENLLKDEVKKQYFFRKLQHIEWFIPLMKGGYFNPNPDTQPQETEKGNFFIPQWNVLPYLEKVSQQVDKPENEKYIEELIKIIKDVTEYHIKNNKALDNYRTWSSFVKILCNIPNDKIPNDIIDLIPIWLDSRFDTLLQGSEITTNLLPKFLTDNSNDIKKAEKIIDYITALKEEPIATVIEPFYLKETFEKYSEDIGNKCSENVIKDFTTKIKKIPKDEQYLIYIWNSFYNEDESYIEAPLETLTFILKKVLLAKANHDINVTKKILKNFLEDEDLYFPKMALYIMGQNMDKYEDFFWEVVVMNTGELIFANKPNYGDELKYVLKNLKNLTNERRKILQEKINNAVKRLNFKEDVETRIAKHKQKIYEALSHDPFFKNLYDEMKKITNVDVELKPVIGKFEIRGGPGPSPLTEDEIMKMPNDNLADFLQTFKTENQWDGPSVDGLADLLFEIAKENPEKFTEHIDPFVNTGYYYIYKILQGIKDAWNAKKEIDWEKLLNFIEQYINRTEFWEDKFIIDDDGWNATHKWIVGIVSEVIQDGTKDDSWAFPEKHFNQSEKIIFLLLNKLKSEENKEITDYVMYTLNSSWGKTISALINLALRKARVDEKKGIESNIKWSVEIKQKYEEILNKEVIEGYTCFGQYLPNFYYLDKEWVQEKIKSIENAKDTEYREAFMTGYLSSGKVYDDLYNLMGSHYRYGIDYNFKEKIYNKLLVQHIAIGYLRNNETLNEEGSLFKKILDIFNYEQIASIIHFFWIQRDYLTKDDEISINIRENIIEFWRWLYDKYKCKQGIDENDKKILSEVTKLTVFLPKLNKDNSEWLKLSTRYLEIDFDSSYFIEYLNKLTDKGDSKETSKYIGEIFLIMLINNTPDFDQIYIQSIIEFLFKEGNRDTARKICNIYAQRGYEFIRDIYNNNNKYEDKDNS